MLAPHIGHARVMVVETNDIDGEDNDNWSRSAEEIAELAANLAEPEPGPPPGRSFASDFRRAPSIDVKEWRGRRERIVGRARMSNVLPLKGARPRASRRTARAQATPAVAAPPIPEPPGPPPGLWSLGPALVGHSRHAVLLDLAQDVVALLVQTLEQQPELAARLQRALGLEGAGRPAETSRPRFMSVKEYAVHACVSERTIRQLVKTEMKEGGHFHRDGRTGRRVIIHVDEADAWRASRSFARSNERTVEDLATNEVLRRRAKTAPKKAGLR